MHEIHLCTVPPCHQPSFHFRHDTISIHLYGNQIESCLQVHTHCMSVYICKSQNIQLCFFNFHSLLLNPCNRKGLVDLFYPHWLSKIYQVIRCSEKCFKNFESQELTGQHCQNPSRQQHTSIMKNTGHKPVGHWARTTRKEEDAWGNTNTATTRLVHWEMLQTVKGIYCLWSHLVGSALPRSKRDLLPLTMKDLQ